MRSFVLAVLSLITACARADPPGRLSLRVTPLSIDGRGETSAISIAAVLESGAPGRGVVTLSTDGPGIVAPAAVTLDTSGAASATYACRTDIAPGCAGPQALIARWAELERRVSVFVGVVAVVDGGRPVVLDAGARPQYDDAGCVRVFSSSGVREECLTTDGGACVVDENFDGGRGPPSCSGLEGEPCWSDRACRVGLCDAMGRCSSWVCRTTSGPCGDGGTCLDLGLSVAPYCSTFAAGSLCDTEAQCLDGGVCKSYTGVGSKTCSYGRFGQGCAAQSDCREGTCVVAACR